MYVYVHVKMADHTEVLERIKRKVGVSYPVLTPNLQGFKAAVSRRATGLLIKILLLN